MIFIKVLYVIMYFISLGLMFRGAIVQRNQNKEITFWAWVVWFVLCAIRLIGLI